jgi:hypothetical protein
MRWILTEEEVWVFHVNLLRKWKTRELLAFYARAYVMGEEIEDYLPACNPTETWKDVNISNR